MEEITLEAQIREGIGRVKVTALRKEGFIPAVVYSEGKHSQAIKISRSQLIKLLHQHRLENAILNLKIKDDKKAKGRSCLIKEIQYDPVGEHIVHVDFNEISLTKNIKVNVPVVAKGESIGVKQEGGSLELVLWELEVECLPTDIPKEIGIDISQLKLRDSVHVKDILPPAGVKIFNDPSAIVLSIAEPMKEEVPAAEGLVEGEGEKQEPEVIKEKKEVPEEEGKAEEGKEKEKK